MRRKQCFATMPLQNKSFLLSSEFQSDFDNKVGTQQTKYNILYSAVVAYVQNNSLIHILMY